MINRRVGLFYRYPLKTLNHMVCPCTLYGVCVVCPGTSELVGQQKIRTRMATPFFLVNLIHGDQSYFPDRCRDYNLLSHFCMVISFVIGIAGCLVVMDQKIFTTLSSSAVYLLVGSVWVQMTIHCFSTDVIEVLKFNHDQSIVGRVCCSEKKKKV